MMWLKLTYFTNGLTWLRSWTVFLAIERVTLRGYLSIPATAQK